MPYVMVKSERNLTGNDRYEGFCIDLLKAISGMVGFNYVIELVPDKKFGAQDPDTGEWNGVVRQIMDKVCISLTTISFTLRSRCMDRSAIGICPFVGNFLIHHPI